MAEMKMDEFPLFELRRMYYPSEKTQQVETDLISRQAAIDELISEPPEMNYGFYYAEKIKALPSAQPEQLDIVRCKDCKWYWESELLSPNRFCFRLKDNNGKRVGYNFTDNDFCSRAERREDG